MRLVPRLCWELEGEANESLDERLMPLLEAIAASASLAGAVAACGISYRAAWGLLRDYERKLGTPLALLERGRGARLAPAGERLLGLNDAAARRLARILPGLAAELGPAARARRSTRAAPALRLRVAASHDLALAALAESLSRTAALALELSFVGSLQALKEFIGERADVAGFHVPLAQGIVEPLSFLRLLRPSRHRLIRFADREQGLILPRGNPAQVKSFRDIERKGLRLVNRQRGSGTRFLIDRMIADGGIEPFALAGYAREEFTHAAVAATVASGGADAGFGLRAAAAEYRLAFVPLARERYYLAARVRDLETPAVRGLIDALRSAAFAGIAKRLPGYRPAGAGTVETPAAVKASPPS